MARSQVKAGQPVATKKRSTTRRSAGRSDGSGNGLSWQAEKSLNTRSQILEAGIECLVEYGYAETKTERIAKGAGVSRGAMTHHFPSRAELFQAIYLSLLGKPRGPRAGAFLAILGPEFVAGRFRQAATSGS